MPWDERANGWRADLPIPLLSLEMRGEEIGNLTEHDTPNDAVCRHRPDVLRVSAVGDGNGLAVSVDRVESNCVPTSIMHEHIVDNTDTDDEWLTGTLFPLRTWEWMDGFQD